MLRCTSTSTPGHPLLLAAENTAQPTIAVFDIGDPLRPDEICTLTPALGGRFISGVKIAFWTETQLGLADLVSGVVTITATLPATAVAGAIGPDGTTFVYRQGDNTNGSTTYLHSAGSDQTLYTRPALGGHGGPPWGPLSQLVFSPDGRYLLAFDFFTTRDDPLDKFLVYRVDGSLAFTSPTAEFGAWAPSGDKLYFLASSQVGGVAGDVHMWDPSDGETTVATGLSSYFWPVVSPDGGIIAFNSYDNLASPSASTSRALALPHLWRLELPQGSIDELSNAQSTKPVFVGSVVIWSDEEQPCECGPGGNSVPTGRVIAHVIAGGDSAVTWPGTLATQDPMRAILDVWLPRQ